MKIVINKCFGGFGISDIAIMELAEMKSECIVIHEPKDYYGGNNKNSSRAAEWESKYLKDLEECEDIGNGYKGKKHWGGSLYKDGKIFTTNVRHDDKMRTHKDLIAVVEKLGEKSFGDCAELEIVEVPDDVEYYIHDYDGMEQVHEQHRSW